MLKISTNAMVEIAGDHGWLHTRGRLEGAINAKKMAHGLGVTTSSVIRAYSDGATGLRLLEKLQEISGRSLDSLVVKVKDDEGFGEQPVAAGEAREK